jgi:hypothetical protein
LPQPKTGTGEINVECRETGYRDEPEPPEDEQLIDAAIEDALLVQAFTPYMNRAERKPAGSAVSGATRARALGA